MKIRFIVGMAGPGVRFAPGDETDMPKAQAERLIAAGIAEAVDEPQPATKAKRKSKSNGDN